MSFSASIDVLKPTATEVETVRQNRETIAEICRHLDSSGEPGPMRLPVLGTLDLPRSAVRALMRILSELAEGHAVAVHALEEEEEITTSQAAQLLGVSRPTLIGLLDRGEIPYRRIGTHRRLRLSQVLAHRERMEQPANQRFPSSEERLRGLREMAQYTDRIGLGY